MDPTSSGDHIQFNGGLWWRSLLLLELQICGSTILLHASLSIAILLQFWTFILPRSSLISSSYLNLGVPILLTAIGLHSVTLLTALSLSILTICPICLILCALVYRTVATCLDSKSISGLRKVIYDFSSSISGGESSFETWVCRTKPVS